MVDFRNETFSSLNMDGITQNIINYDHHEITNKKMDQKLKYNFPYCKCKSGRKRGWDKENVKSPTFQLVSEQFQVVRLQFLVLFTLNCWGVWR